MKISPLQNPFTGSDNNRRNLLTGRKPRKKTDEEHESIEVDSTSFYAGVAVLAGVLLFALQIFMMNASSASPVYMLDTRIEASPEELLQTPTTHAWWTPTYFLAWMRRHRSSSSSSPHIDSDDIPYWQAGYASQQEMDERLIRFPRVEDRVKIYMSNWYAPPCPDKDGGAVPFNYEIDKSRHLTKTYIQELPSPFAPRPRLFQIYDQPTTETSTLFYLQRKALTHHEECTNSPACQDVLYQMLPVVQRSPHPETPTLLDLGDKSLTFASSVSTTTTRSEQWLENPQVPYFKRYRMALTKAEVDEMTVVSCVKGRRGLPESTGFPHLQPVLWKLKVLRHYGLIHNVTEFDIPYADKKDMAVFRGRLSGILKQGSLDMTNDHTTTTSSSSGNGNAYTTCMGIPRCRLVLENNAVSSGIDARLVGPQKGLPRAVQDTETGKSLDLFTFEKMSVEEMLRYKAIIMFEGNDVAAGLKWALFSNSVVMMDPVTVYVYFNVLVVHVGVESRVFINETVYFLCLAKTPAHLGPWKSAWYHGYIMFPFTPMGRV